MRGLVLVNPGKEEQHTAAMNIFNDANKEEQRQWYLVSFLSYVKETGVDQRNLSYDLQCVQTCASCHVIPTMHAQHNPKTRQ